jgi:CheY-like chemotaxis protein/anti-sigma regulatory factor (Ser/Thr protein kinase)
VALLSPLARERQVTIDVDLAALAEGVHVLADRNRLKQVLINLLSNAIKYNRAGGRVAVACAGGDSGRVRITVTDTGIGIGAEHLEHLFEPFERLGAQHTAIEGTGLGLALSKGLIEAMGGTITVDSRQGQGSSFVVELTAAEHPHGRDRAGDTGRPAVDPRLQGAPSWRVLYIEDNLSNLSLIQRILDRYPGIELISAMQGSIGLELAREHHPDLIILDLHLPDMTGVEVLKRLRADEHRHTPVVVVTADATKGQADALRRLGADEYLTKPIDVSRFLEAISQHLRLAPAPPR